MNNACSFGKLHQPWARSPFHLERDSPRRFFDCCRAATLSSPRSCYGVATFDPALPTAGGAPRHEARDKPSRIGRRSLRGRRGAGCRSARAEGGSGRVRARLHRRRARASSTSPGTDTCLRIGGRVRAERIAIETFDRRDDAIGFLARGRLNVDARTADRVRHAARLLPLRDHPLHRRLLRFRLGPQRRRRPGPVPHRPEPRPGLRPVRPAHRRPHPVLLRLLRQRSRLLGPARLRPRHPDARLHGDLRRRSRRRSRSRTGSSGASSTARPTSACSGSSGDRSCSRHRDPARHVLPRVDRASAARPRRTASAHSAIDNRLGARRSSRARCTRSARPTSQPFRGGPANVPRRTCPDTEYGFAVQGGVKINLPFIAAGDVLWLQAAYADGAINYLGFGTDTSVRNRGPFILNQSDAFVNAFGDLKTTEGFAIVGAFAHYFTPQIRGELMGSYGQLDYDRSATGIVTAASAFGRANRRLVGARFGFVDTRGVPAGGERDLVAGQGPRYRRRRALPEHRPQRPRDRERERRRRRAPALLRRPGRRHRPHARPARLLRPASGRRRSAKPSAARRRGWRSRSTPPAVALLPDQGCGLRPCACTSRGPVPKPATIVQDRS